MSSFLDFIYPKQCFSCSESLERNEFYICGYCTNELQNLNDFDRFIFLKNYLKKQFSNCFIPFQFDEQSQKILHLLKYNYLKPIGTYIANLIYSHFETELKHAKNAVIIPCPLHKRKLKEREYNQAELIAQKLSELSSIPMDTKSLIRTRYTKTQTRLNKTQREKNLRNSFQFKGAGTVQNAFLVDDVITTGTTLNKMAEAIHQLNPEINCIAIAFASPIRF